MRNANIKAGFLTIKNVCESNGIFVEPYNAQLGNALSSKYTEELAFLNDRSWSLESAVHMESLLVFRHVMLTFEADDLDAENLKNYYESYMTQRRSQISQMVIAPNNMHTVDHFRHYIQDIIGKQCRKKLWSNKKTHKRSITNGNLFSDGSGNLFFWVRWFISYDIIISVYLISSFVFLISLICFRYIFVGTLHQQLCIGNFQRDILYGIVERIFARYRTIIKLELCFHHRRRKLRANQELNEHVCGCIDISSLRFQPNSPSSSRYPGSLWRDFVTETGRTDECCVGWRFILRDYGSVVEGDGECFGWISVQCSGRFWVLAEEIAVFDERPEVLFPNQAVYCDVCAV